MRSEKDSSSSRQPAGHLFLGTQEIDLWRADTQDLAGCAAQLASTLSADERERAGSFRHRRDRERFIRRRGLLRTILGRYLARDPDQIVFRYAPFGKPLLDPVHHASPLTFNQAHSKDLILSAVSRRRWLGVDVEAVEPIDDLAGVSAQFLSRADSAVLASLPAQERLPAFYTRWTRLEAYLKATGEGLSGSRVQIEAGLDSIVWKILAVDPAPGYLGAVAADEGDWRVSFRDWSAGRTALRPAPR